MIFANLDLAKRLEGAEAFACAQFAVARKRLYPESNSAWMKCAGATVVFDGIDAPTTQTFGLGLFEELTPTALDEIEQFFLKRGAEVMHEVCPFAGAATLDLLCARGYRPFEISNVMYRAVEPPTDSQARHRELGRSPNMERHQRAWLDSRTSRIRKLCARNRRTDGGTGRVPVFPG
jgi:hypothetical protein